MIELLYTDSDRAIAALGLTSDDIGDAVFEAKDLARVLGVELFRWLPSHASVYTGSDGPPATQADFNSDCLVLYCTYFAAAKIADAALSFFSKESDGQSEYQRPAVDFAALSRDMLEKSAYYREALLSALSDTVNIASRVRMTTVVTPVYDPVTG